MVSGNLFSYLRYQEIKNASINSQFMCQIWFIENLGEIKTIILVQMQQQKNLGNSSWNTNSSARLGRRRLVIFVMKQAQSEHDSELIEIFPTGFGPTEAQNFFVFDWEFIVIGNFFTISDGLLRINGDFLLPIDSNNFSITIGLKRTNKFILQVPRQESRLRL